MTGVDEYFLRMTPKWQKVFEGVANQVNRLGMDLRRFVDAQLEWVISRNRKCSLWPTILSGGAAVSRYHLFPSDEKELQRLRELYNTQYEVFLRVCDNVSEDAAFDTSVLKQNPLFVLYMHYERNRQPNKGLVEDARLELERFPHLSKILPEAFMEYLDGCRA